jgi:hypothetical protein
MRVGVPIFIYGAERSFFTRKVEGFLGCDTDQATLVRGELLSLYPVYELPPARPDFTFELRGAGPIRDGEAEPR